MKILLWDEIIIVVLLSIAALVSVAVHNDKNILESPIKASSRRLMIMAQVLTILRIFWSSSELSDGSSLSLSYFLIFLLWGIGSIMSNVDLFARGWGREISSLLHPKTNYERRKSRRRGA